MEKSSVMKEALGAKDTKLEAMVSVELDFLQGRLSFKEAKERINESLDVVTGQEFALSEQYLSQFGVTDAQITERLDEMLALFADIWSFDSLQLEAGHPIDTYWREVQALQAVLAAMKGMLAQKFIKNPWAEIYDQLAEIEIHFQRKQNQLYPYLERKGFDKPTKVMWSLEDDVEEAIKRARRHLDKDEDEQFLNMQEEVIGLVQAMLIKETEILYPTALDLLSQQEFVEMRQGDDEIGYCLIERPPLYGDVAPAGGAATSAALLKDLAAVLQKHQVLPEISGDQVLDVSQGQLTLEQINLIFKHLKVDLSFVDEHEIMRFYTDTKHRVFPRSPGVIGRSVQNCHPRESVGKVEKIIEAFRSGLQDEAEFWLDQGDKFIYINFTAVRDEKGNFRGVLESMQDVAKIRSLSGTRRLVAWGGNTH